MYKIFTRKISLPGCFNKGKDRAKTNLKRFAMRISILYIIILTGSMQLMATHTKSQSLGNINVMVEMNGEHLKSLFNKIEKQTSLKFVFVVSEVESYDKIYLDSDERSVEETLNLALRQTGLGYEQSKDNILIYQLEKENNIPERIEQRKAMIPVIIKGKVTDSDGKPLPNATIMIKGTLKGITTDLGGNYTITVPNSETVLIFSYVGFAKKEIKVGGQSTINVVLEQSAMELEAVTINAGYYTVTEREKTGSISRVAAKEIENQPVNDPLKALQGRMPGVFITESTGVPGSSGKIQIRGQNSLRTGFYDNGNLPLYIINGVPAAGFTPGIIGGSIIGNPQNPLNMINPKDIESIEILKDADATAIYGSRGANGVILITTKQGKAGKTAIDIDMQTGWGVVANRYDVLNREQYLEMRNEAFANDNATPGITDYDLNGDWDNTRETDWQDVFFGGTAKITNVNASVSWGNEKTRFLLGSGYYRETTVFPGDFFQQKYSANFSLNHRSADGKLKIDFSANYLDRHNKLFPNEPTLTAITLAPVAPKLFHEDGTLNWQEGTWHNPYALLTNDYFEKSSNLVSNALISYKIIDQLTFKTSLGYTKARTDQTRLGYSTSINPFRSTPPTGSSAFSNWSSASWIVEPQIEYKQAIGKGVLSAIVGVTLQQNTSDFLNLNAWGFTSDALLNNPQAAQSLDANVKNTEYRYNALFGRINYNLKDKYIINVTGRRDGSSRFGPGRQFANFAAVGAAWIFSEEEFIKKQFTFLSFGKLRASYGSTGSDQIGDYQFFDLYDATRFPYSGSTATAPTSLFNPDYGWEINKKFEVNLDLGFVDDRILLSMAYFRNTSSNQLIGRPLPSITGFNVITSNFPAKVLNRGLEISLNTVIINKKDFQWTSDFNISFPYNELLEFPNIENTSYRYWYVVGEPLSVVNAYHYTGVDPETGLHTFEDVNGDGILSPTDDYQALTNTQPKFYGGFANKFTYKGFELDVFFQFVKQNGGIYLYDAPGKFVNQSVEVLDRWQNPGDKTNTQKFTQGFGDAFLAFYYLQGSDARVIDASYIRLKNVSISYLFPKDFVKKLGIQKLKLYLQGQNLLTITNYDGLDPETGFSLPPLRVITAGLQVTL